MDGGWLESDPRAPQQRQVWQLRLVWVYIAAQSRLLAEGTDIRILRGIAKVWLYMAAGFGFAMILGLISVYIEYASWILWGPVVSAWWYRERMKYI